MPTAQGVQLYIKVLDHDDSMDLYDSDDLIDILLIDHDLPAGVRSTTQTYNGVLGYLTMNLTIKAMCAEGFIGSDCTQCVHAGSGVTCDSSNMHVPTTSIFDSRQLTTLDSHDCKGKDYTTTANG